MEGYILLCPTAIHTWSFIIQYTFMDLFYFWEVFDIAGYPDDTTIYTVNENKKKSQSLVHGLIRTWFNKNFVKANSVKSHLIMSCTEATTAVILLIDSSKTEVLLEIKIYH